MDGPAGIEHTPAWNQVSGAVFVSETRAGIPGLLISLFDVSSKSATALEQEQITARVCQRPEGKVNIPGTRIGSVITDLDGTFTLKYNDCAPHTAHAQPRPALLLTVGAPEACHLTPCPRLLYASCEIRQSAGRIESYAIAIARAQLQAAGIPLPSTGGLETNATAAEAVAQDSEQTRSLTLAARDVGAGLLQNEQTLRQGLASSVSQAVGALSRVPEHARIAGRFVTPGESVHAASERVATASLKTISTAAQRTGFINLGDKQINSLKDGTGQLPANVDADAFGSMLFGTSDTTAKPTALAREDPIVAFCRARTFPGDACAGTADGGAPAPTAGTAPESPGQAPAAAPMTADQLPDYLGRLLAPIASPEEALGTDSGRRASQKDVQGLVDSFTLRGGPANAVAFYDFHHLEIAFNYVWQEAFDAGVISATEELYRDLANRGGAVTEIPPGTPPDAVLTALKKDVQAFTCAQGDPPPQVLAAFDVQPGEWQNLTAEQRLVLQQLAQEIVGSTFGATVGPPTGIRTGPTTRTDPFSRTAAAGHANIEALRAMGQRILSYAAGGAGVTRRYTGLSGTLNELERRLKEPYAFTVFAANARERSVNFGVIATYRQRWEPVSYQAGRLIKTIPLAPREVRRFNAKQVIKQTRSQRELENSMSSRRNESAVTTRAEADIVSRAQNKTNFTASAEGGYNVAVVNVSAKTGFQRDAQSSSESTKKDFRDDVIKAAEEYKQERTLEVNTGLTAETETGESGEISNPNDELTVTYLFYELQRRYRVSERLQRVTPVVLVAQEVPRPDQIDDAWVISYDWILSKSILHDSFLAPLAYLSTGSVGDEYSLDQLRKNVEQQRAVIDSLRQQVTELHAVTATRYVALEQEIARRANLIASGTDGAGILESILDPIGLFSPGGDPKAAAQIREDAAKDAAERAAREENDLRARLTSEVTALNTATDSYTRQLTEYLNRRAQVDRLELHIKENILYYMQAIWSSEPDAQRYLRLSNVPVPDLRGGKTSYSLVEAKGARTVLPPGTTTYKFTMTWIPSPLTSIPLVEAADLDNLIGFKGNYMMFPLVRSNDLTDFMVAPYADPLLGVADPDDTGNWTLDSFADYICCLKSHLTAAEWTEMLPWLRDQYANLLEAPLRQNEEIIVPTESVFIEALPGTHPIIEDFKLRHRALDVQRAAADVRHAELENLRAAARLLAGERDDPDSEKRVLITGKPAGVMVAE